jgi:hypothetical protein
MHVLLGTTVKTIPDPATVSPGFAGFLVVFCLAVATVFLIRSMVKHLRKVNFVPRTDATDPTNAAATDARPSDARDLPAPPADRRR